MVCFVATPQFSVIVVAAAAVGMSSFVERVSENFHSPALSACLLGFPLRILDDVVGGLVPRSKVFATQRVQWKSYRLPFYTHYRNRNIEVVNGQEKEIYYRFMQTEYLSQMIKFLYQIAAKNFQNKNKNCLLIPVINSNLIFCVCWTFPIFLSECFQ